MAWDRCANLAISNGISGQRQTRRKRNLDWRVEQIFLKGVDNPMFHFVIDRTNLRSLVPNERHAAAAATLRTANENITRVTPLIIMLTPTSVPIAQTELEGHCR